MRGIKEEDTGNNLSTQRGSLQCQTMARRKSLLRTLYSYQTLNTLYRVHKVTMLYESHKHTTDWTCCYARSLSRGEIRGSFRGLNGIQEEDPSNVLQRKHDQTLMDAERPRTAYNSITFEFTCRFLCFYDLMAFFMVCPCSQEAISTTTQMMGTLSSLSLCDIDFGLFVTSMFFFFLSLSAEY